MNFLRIKSQLDKIQRTVEMIESDGQITKLEVDLLKDYIKRLYEMTVSEGMPEGQPKTEQKAKMPLEKEDIQNGSHSTEAVPSIEKKPIQKPEAEVAVEKKVEEEVEVMDDVPEEILELFEEQEATELSEKLSKLAINDIEKSMSINEKIFTINELFNGNSNAFRECLGKLNNLSDYNEAVDYLSKDIAAPYEWADEAKRKKALNFIHLVSRKFQ